MRVVSQVLVVVLMLVGAVFVFRTVLDNTLQTGGVGVVQTTKDNESRFDDCIEYSGLSFDECRNEIFDTE